MASNKRRSHRLEGGFWATTPTLAIMDERLPAPVVHVLTVISSFTHFANGANFPSVRAISERGRISESTVRRAIPLLAECGYLEVTKRFLPSGEPTSNRYVVLFPAPSPALTDEVEALYEHEAEPTESGTVPQTVPSHRQDPLSQGYLPPVSQTPPTTKQERLNKRDGEEASSPEALLEEALAPYLRTARFPDAVRRTVRAAHTDMGQGAGNLFPLAVVTQALVEMQGANASFSAAALAGFCRGVVERAKTERARGLVVVPMKRKASREPVEKRDPSAPLPDWRKIVEETASGMGADPVVVPEASSRESDPTPETPARDPRSAAEKARLIREAADEARRQKGRAS